MIRQSPMHSLIAHKPLRGERIDRLTMEAVDMWFATERDRRRVEWIDEQLGPQAHIGWRALGLFVARAEIFSAEGRLCWQPMPAADRYGDPVIVIPCWASDAAHWGGQAVIDLVAVDPRDPSRVAARTGACEALGELDAEISAEDGEPILWFRSALSWLRDGGDTRRQQGLRDGTARFFPLQSDARTAQWLLLQASEIHAEDEELGHELAERAKQLRKQLTPAAPTILVADEAREAA